MPVCNLMIGAYSATVMLSEHLPLVMPEGSMVCTQCTYTTVSLAWAMAKPPRLLRGGMLAMRKNI